MHHDNQPEKYSICWHICKQVVGILHSAKDGGVESKIATCHHSSYQKMQIVRFIMKDVVVRFEQLS